jgi:predicted RND superfamily exporter protein
MKPKISVPEKVASLVTRKPWISLMIAVAIGAALVPGMQKLGADFSYRVWFKDDDPLLLRFESFERRFGSDENVAVVVHSPSGIFDEDSVHVVQELTRELWQVPEVIRVDSITNHTWTRADGDDILIEPFIDEYLDLDPAFLDERRRTATEDETLNGYLINDTADTTIIFVRLRPTFEASPDYELVIHGDATSEPPREGVRDKIRKVEGTSDHTFHVTGMAALSDGFREASKQDMKTMLPVLIGAIVLLLIMLLRRFSGVVLPFVVIIFALVMAFGFAGFTGIKFSIVLTMLPNILCAIAIADAVHILTTYFQQLNVGRKKIQAAYHAVAENLRPTFITSATTAIGFFSFASADLRPLSDLGILAGFGTLAAWVGTIFLIAPLLMLLPIRSKNTARVPSDANTPRPWALAVSRWIGLHRRAIVLCFAVVALASALIALRTQVDANPFEYFAEDFPLRQAQEFVEAEVGGSIGPEIVVDSGRADGIKDPDFLSRVELFVDWLQGLPYVTRTVSVLDVLKSTNRALHADDPSFYRVPSTRQEVAEQLFLYNMSVPQGKELNDRVTIDNDALRVTVLWTLHTANNSMAAARAIQSKAIELGLDAVVTGKMMLYRAMNGHVVRSYLRSLAITVIAIAALLILTFRSVRIGLLSLIPNTIPLLVGGALVVLLGKTLDIGTVLVTAVCLGIAVDDTIHFLDSFYRWQRAGLDPTRSIAMVFQTTGPALATTTLILVAGFGTFMLASYTPNVNFGILTAAVLTTTLAATMLLLPALLLSRTAANTDE